jgi:6-phosphogluconolactonase
MTSPAASSFVVYVANADSADISVLSLDAATGAVRPLQRFEAGGKVMPLALSPDRRFLYASIRSEPVSVLTLAIDAKSGTLSRVGSAPLPASMCWIVTDRSGRFLLSAAYGDSVVAVSPIGEDGIVQSAIQVLATPPNAHSIQSDPSNRFAFAASLGGGVVMQYRFDVSTGQLVANEQPSVAPHPKASPRHFAFHPNGHTVHLVNELDAKIDVLEFDPTTGRLSAATPPLTFDALPPGTQGAPWAADIHVSPDGKFLFTSERRSSTLASWRIDAGNGALELIGHVPTETQPRGFRLTPDGRYAVVVGELSDALSVHAIDPETGALRKVGGCAVGGDPNWVEIVAL